MALRNQTALAQASPDDPTVAASLLAGPLGAMARCPGCEAAPASPAGFCAACWDWLSTAVAALPAPTLDRCWLGAYAGPWHRALAAMKSGGSSRTATALGVLLGSRVVAWRGWAQSVCPVPASRGRVRELGFDHAAILARQVSRALDVDCTPVLARSRSSVSQKRLGRSLRDGNAASSFAATRRPAKRVVLVDDVLTTGATIAACTEALLSAGAEAVRVAVVARVVAARRPDHPE